MTFDLKAQSASISSAIWGLCRIVIVFFFNLVKSIKWMKWNEWKKSGIVLLGYNVIILQLTGSIVTVSDQLAKNV